MAYQDVDIKMVASVLERLCNDGLVVRWYEVVEAPGPGSTLPRERQAVYRRVTAA